MELAAAEECERPGGDRSKDWGRRHLQLRFERRTHGSGGEQQIGSDTATSGGDAMSYLMISKDLR